MRAVDYRGGRVFKAHRLVYHSEAQGPSRTCDESKEDEEEAIGTWRCTPVGTPSWLELFFCFITLKPRFE